MENREKFIMLLKRLFVVKTLTVYPDIQSNLIDKGRMTIEKVFKYYISHSFEEISDYELFLFGDALHEKYPYLDPVRFFSSKEINEYSDKRVFTNKSVSSNDFLPPLRIIDKLSANGDLLFSITAKTIFEMEEKGVICFSWRFVNNHIKVINEEDFFEKMYNTTYCKKIQEEIIENKFHPKVLRFFAENTLAKYDIKDENFIVKSGKIILVAGAEELAAIKAVVKQKYDMSDDIKFPVIISFGTHKDIMEMTSQKILEKEKIQEIHTERHILDFSKKVVANITKSKNLIQSISIVKFKIRLEGIIPKEMLIDSINVYFGDYSGLGDEDLDKLSDFIIDFYNFIITVFPEDFKDFSKYKERRWCTNSSFLCGVLYIASIIYKNQIENWKDSLKEKLLSVEMQRGKISITELHNEIKRIGDAYNGKIL